VTEVKPLARGTRWHPAERRIIENAAKRFAAGRYVRLSEGTEYCLRKLRNWYAALPEAEKPGRVYPRTSAAVRNQLYKAVVQRGYEMSRVLWSPPERRLAYKWAKEFLQQRKDGPPLARLDAGRGLLVELFMAGYDRTLDACTMELDKCRRDIVQGVPRHCGRGDRTVSLPASVLPGRAAARRATAPHWTFVRDGSKAGKPRARRDSRAG
jgi:hypothetical protein